MALVATVLVRSCVALALGLACSLGCYGAADGPNIPEDFTAAVHGYSDCVRLSRPGKARVRRFCKSGTRYVCVDPSTGLEELVGPDRETMRQHCWMGVFDVEMRTIVGYEVEEKDND